jgi:hypothetical protein
VVHEEPRRRPERRFGGGRELNLLGIVESLPTDRARGGELAKNLIHDGGIEKIIKNDVRKRLRIDVGRIRGFTDVPHARER